MNVYFCDVCGVRVTDVDLRSGHGMLRVHDVICATCLDMGHGKEWLAARAGEASSAVAFGASQRPSGPGAAALLDYARDRAATVDDEDDDAPHEVVAVGHTDEDGTDTRLAHHSSLGADAQARHLDHEDTSLVEPVATNFSGAAAGFAALSQSPVVGVSDDADGEVTERVAEEVDSGLMPAISSVAPASTPALARRPSEEHVASPFTTQSDDESAALINVNEPSARSSARSSTKRGRSDSLRKPAASGRTTPTGNRSSVAVGLPKKSSSSSAAVPTKTGSGKFVKSKSGRSGKRGASGPMPMPMKIALVTVPLIILITIVMIAGRSGSGSKVADVKDLHAQKEQISRNFNEAQKLVNDAYVSKNVAQMKAADQRWKQFMQEWDQFSGDAMKYSKWSEENCNEYWEALRAPDVNGRTKLLRDEIVKQSNAH